MTENEAIMRIYLTVDGGTTNTRVSLVKNRQIIATKKINRGARAGIDDKDGLKTALRDTIAELLSNNGLTEKDVCRIIASGMITSEFGLYEIPHATAPIGIAELHDSMTEVTFPEISQIPFVFIRGVKIDSEDLSHFDMMRGEETELMGISVLYPVDASDKRVFVLPGSHSKIITTDESGRIADFSTMLTGEMIMSLSQNTILKDAVDFSIEICDPEYILKGCDFALKEGLNKALFKVRVLKNAFMATPCEVYSFYIGAILAEEIENIVSIDCSEIIIGGRHQIKEATAILIEALSDKRVTVLTDSEVEGSTAIGAISIFEYL